jgi:hypothetical protein
LLEKVNQSDLLILINHGSDKNIVAADERDFHCE